MIGDFHPIKPFARCVAYRAIVDISRGAALNTPFTTSVSLEGISMLQFSTGRMYIFGRNSKQLPVTRGGAKVGGSAFCRFCSFTRHAWRLLGHFRGVNLRVRLGMLRSEFRLRCRADRNRGGISLQMGGVASEFPFFFRNLGGI